MGLKSKKTMNKKTISIAVALASISPDLLYAEQTKDNATKLEQTVVTGTHAKEAHDIKIEPSSTSKLNVSLEDLPRSVDIISNDEFTERGSLNLQDTLNYTSGVFAGPFGIDTRLDSSQIRGIKPQQFEDGFIAFEGFYNAPRVEIFTYENIEVVKGPSSTLYGQGALGGIINANSKLPKEDAQGEFGVQIGENSRVQTMFDSTGAINEDGSLLYRFVALNRDADTEVEYVQDDALVLMPSLTWKPSEDTQLTILAKHQKHDTGSTLQFIPSLDATPGFYAPAPPFPAPTLPALTELDIDTNTFVGEPDFDKYETESNSVSAMFEHNLNDMLTLATNTRYWKSESTYQYTQAIGYSFAPPYLPALVPTLPPLTAPGDVYRLHYASEKELEIFANNLALKANGNWLGLEHNAQIGLDYVKADTVDDRARDPVLEALYQSITMNPNAVLPGAFLADSKINLLDPQYSGATTIPTTKEYRDSSNEQIGLYLGDIMRAGNVIASVNVRYDRVKQSFDRVGIYGAADSTSYSDTLEDVNTDFALMYQFENGISPYYSYAESFTPNDADQNGNLVDPNEGSQHEIGVKFLSSESNTLVTAAIFQIDEDNRVTDTDPANFKVIDASYEGAELSVQHQIEDIHIQSSYTYLDTEQKQTGASKLKVPSVADEMANTWISYIPSGGALNGFRAGIGARYIGNTVSDTNIYETAGYTLYDAMLGYRFADVDLQLNVSNLTDKEYVVGVSDQDLGASSFKGPERYASLTAKYLF